MPRDASSVTVPLLERNRSHAPSTRSLPPFTTTDVSDSSTSRSYEAAAAARGVTWRPAMASWSRARSKTPTSSMRPVKYWWEPLMAVSDCPTNTVLVATPTALATAPACRRTDAASAPPT